MINILQRRLSSKNILPQKVEEVNKKIGGPEDIHFYFFFIRRFTIYVYMKTTTVNCNNCNIQFEKRNADYNRSQKLSKPHFCCRRCSIISSNQHLTKEQKVNRYKRIQGCKHARTTDELSPFRKVLLKVKMRSSKCKYENTNLDLMYLKKLWDDQQGICPYTGIKMILPKSTSENNNLQSLKKASLDRIDSSKGYVIGNVEFVCRAINYAKNSFSKKEMREFLSEIKI